MLFFLLILLISLVVLYRRMKHKRSIEEQSEEIYLRELLSTFHMDNMEVKRSQITLYETLGEGAFGIVRKGKLMPHSMDVAVKMVKAGKIFILNCDFTSPAFILFRLFLTSRQRG